MIGVLVLLGLNFKNYSFILDGLGDIEKMIGVVIDFVID